MRFAHPYYLSLLLLVPALALFYAYAFFKRAKDLRSFAEPGMLGRIASFDGTLRKARALLLTAGVFFIVLALARPQFGTRLVEMQQQGADVVICVDVSRSMLAEDLKPNRMEKAKDLLSKVAQQLGGNRVGVIAFAGTAFWQCPLTLDISSVNLFLRIMDANLIPLPGTSIGSALRLAGKGLAKTAPKSKAIILLTDGEDHDSDPRGAAAEAAANGIKVYTIGFGDPTGEPIPEKDAGGAFAGYKKDSRGDVVMSKMDEELLTKIAATTGGEYFRAAGGDIDTGRLVEAVQGLEKQELKSRLFRQYEDRYQFFLALGILLVLAEFLMPETRRGKNER